MIIIGDSKKISFKLIYIMEYQSFKLTKECHNIIKEYCKKHHLIMTDWVSMILLQKINELNLKVKANEQGKDYN